MSDGRVNEKDIRALYGLRRKPLKVTKAMDEVAHADWSRRGRDLEYGGGVPPGLRARNIYIPSETHAGQRHRVWTGISEVAEGWIPPPPDTGARLGGRRIRGKSFTYVVWIVPPHCTCGSFREHDREKHEREHPGEPFECKHIKLVLGKGGMQ